MRPVPEIQFADFIYPAYDQIVNELAKLRYRSGGEYPAPVVIRTPVGGGIRGGHYHSQSPEALFTHIPGLKVVCPSNPYDAKGLLASAIRGEDPVIFMEPKRVYRAARGRGSRGRVHDSARRGQGGAQSEEAAGHRARLVGDGAHRARGGGQRGASRATIWRSSTCARWCPSTRRRSWRRCGRPAGW